jgi:hypothetical protein
MGIDPMLGEKKEARVGLASVFGQGDSQSGKESQSLACEGLVEGGRRGSKALSRRGVEAIL